MSQIQKETLRLSKIQRKVLDRLLDRYERSRTYAGENRVSQSFALSPKEVYPDYESNYEPLDSVHAFEDEMKSMEAEGLVRILWKRESIRRIVLTADRMKMDEAYRLLGRSEKQKVLSEQRTFFVQAMGRSEAADAFCREQLKRIEEGKNIQYPLAEADRILRLIDRIVHNRDDLLERELSIAVFGDSKEFEKNYRQKVCRILQRYSDGTPAQEGRGGAIPEETEDAGKSSQDELLSGERTPREKEMAILEAFGVYANPSYINVKGCGQVTFSDGTIWRLAEDRPVAFSSETVRKIARIQVENRDLMTVENLTSFNRIRRPDTFFLYLSGYHNTVKQHLLMMIRDENTLRYYHFGDIDPDGFLILQHLRKDTGIDFQPYRMGIGELEKYGPYCRPLAQNDITKAGNMLNAGLFPEEMKYMLDHGIKLEQEIISWMEHAAGEKASI